LVTHLNFRVIDFEILELVDGTTFPEDVVGAEKYDVEILQIAVFFAPAQGIAVSHSLVEASALGDFLLAEHHREHELVGDSQLFKGSMFCFHFWLMRERPRAGE
jgi:hypothetical protein